MTHPTGTPPEGDWLGTAYLRFERHGPFAHVVVDRPQARNALTPSMYYGIRYAVEHVDREPDLAGLLITGTGDVFIPGGDFSGDMTDGWIGPAYMGMDGMPFPVLRRSRKPVVAAVNGIAQGGGMIISMMSDIAVASDRATFRAPELLRGISDTSFAELLFRQVGPARARDLLLSGRRLSAQEALDWGVVSRVVPHEQLMDKATEALTEMVQASPRSRVDIKKALDAYYGRYDRMAMDESLGPDGEAREGFMAFFEKRSPSWVPAVLRTDGRL